VSAPYYVDDSVTLYLGDCREVLPTLQERPAACVADPPYGVTAAAWDRWPAGWIEAVGGVLPPDASLWCFGTASLFLARTADFAGWRYAQEALWLKRNGSGPGSRDRLVPIHEWAYHWYRGRWGRLHHEWERERVHAADKSARKDAGPQHRGHYSGTPYVDDGYRQPRSVTWIIEAPSVRYQKRHQDEKPVRVVEALVRECTPPGGLVLDPVAGAGTTGVAARLCGRRALLIEGEERHCEQIAKRLAADVLPIGGV
jgi:site-specific DNA-methyltransferase (adenine-specific)